MKSFLTFGGAFATISLYKSFIKKPCFAECKQWNYNWDGMAAAVAAAGVDKDSEKHLIFIRHGQYYTGDPNDCNRTLTCKGKEQAKLVGKHLQELSQKENIPISKVYVSNLMRAQQTEQLARESFQPCVPSRIETALLQEGAPHPFDPPRSNYVPSPDMYIRCNQSMNQLIDQHLKRPCTNGKTMEIYFCHANIIRYLFLELLQMPRNAWLRFELRHCSITWLVLKPSGRVFLKCFGDTAFLPNEFRTTNNLNELPPQ